DSSEQVEFTRAVAQMIHRDAGLIEHRQQEVCHGGIGRRSQVPSTLNTRRLAAKQSQREVLMGMQVAIVDTRSVEKQRVVEQPAVAFTGITQTLDQIGQTPHAVLI